MAVVNTEQLNEIAIRVIMHAGDARATEEEIKAQLERESEIYKGVIEELGLKEQ